MPKRLFGLLIAAAAVGTPALAQTTGTWVTTGSTLTLAADGGSDAINFTCDPALARVIISTSSDTGANWVTVRANNGGAYAVPMSSSIAGSERFGAIDVADIGQSGVPLATEISVTSPPSDRTAIIANVSPELEALVAACRSGEISASDVPMIQLASD